MNALATEAVAPRDRLGRPLHDLRVSVIDTCNYRCPYCMPADATPAGDILGQAGRLDFDEIETAVRAFARLGVSKLRLTGGEPLLRKDLPTLVARLARVPGITDLALTTNGALLAGQARALREAGLHRLTVSLDALEPALFRDLTGGRGDVADVLAGIAAAEAAGFGSLKINCVVQRGVNESQVLPLARHFRGTPHVLRFIEFMDVGTCNRWQAGKVVPSRELHARIAGQWPLQPLREAYRGEVATRHRYADGQGEVGFISAVSEPFCGDCHRARLSADGQLFTCLFAGQGLPLRESIAAGEAVLAERLRQAWSGRGDRYSEQRAAGPGKGRRIEMYFIGG